MREGRKEIRKEPRKEEMKEESTKETRKRKKNGNLHAKRSEKSGPQREIKHMRKACHVEWGRSKSKRFSRQKCD